MTPLQKMGRQLEMLVTNLLNKLDPYKVTKKNFRQSLNAVNFVENFNKIVEPVTNLQLNDAVIWSMPFPNCAICFTPKPFSTEDINLWARDYRVMSTLVDSPFTIIEDPSLRRVVLGLSEVIPKPARGESRIKRLDYSLYLVPLMFMKDESGKPRFTAQEITGILLHEIGHQVFIATSMRMLYYKSSMFSNAMEYMRKQPSSADLMKILNLCKQYKDIPTVTSKYLKMLLANPVGDNDPNYPAYCDAATWVIATIAGKSESDDFGKFSISGFDTIPDTSQATLSERYSDWFAAQCGYGASLASALARMELEYGPKYIADLLIGDSCTVLYLLTYGFFWTMMADDITSFTDIHGYDPTIKRFQLVIDAAKENLTKGNIPDEQKARMIQTIEDAEAKVKQYSSTSLFVVRQAAFTMMSTLAQATLFIPQLFLNQIHKTYRTIEDAAHKFQSNDLEYLGARLKLMR